MKDAAILGCVVAVIALLRFLLRRIPPTRVPKQTVSDWQKAQAPPTPQGPVVYHAPMGPIESELLKEQTESMRNYRRNRGR